MATRANALDGKPHAVSPHVRLDERDVASADALPPGKWPLLTGTSGGEALSESAWPVTFAEGPRPWNFEVVRDATGVWLEVRAGTTVIIR
ncbi:MAG: hypothetical protein IJ658_09165 [Kiritimatiellae bacterium]|nr:hypothetical protein [Kiritimatiellia bacterium]